MSQSHVDLITYASELLINQAEQSAIFDGGLRCKYRLTKQDGTVLKCAVGFLIPESQYKSTMEDTEVLDLKVKFPKAFVHILKKFKLEDDEIFGELLRDMQQIHDFHKTSEWPEQFETLKQTYLAK